jgi:energy-coupling factor transport system ATP-binding protein
MNARCIAFDEATAMLDPEAREMVLRLMDGLVGSGKTVIHATHDMSEASLASRLLVLDAGAIVFDGSPEELFGEGRRAARSAGRISEAAEALGLPDCAALAVALGLEPRIRESAASLAARIIARPSATGLALRTDPTGHDAARRPARASPEAYAFELKGASHSYLRGTANETPSLRGIDLDLPLGSMVAFVGRTGSGKSTALQLLDGLVAASSGKVSAFGLDLADPRIDLRAPRMRAPLSVQRPESALFELYAGDDVAFGPRNLGLSGKVLVERVRHAMEETGLGYLEFRDRQTRTLSGGEKRRLALAGVLAMDGDALLLDEPTSSLDPATKRSILDFVGGASRRGATVVMATHSMEEAAEADLVAVFAEGRLVASGHPESIFFDRFDPAWGLRRPFACEVVLALEDLGFPIGARPLSIPALAAALS